MRFLHFYLHSFIHILHHILHKTIFMTHTAYSRLRIYLLYLYFEIKLLSEYFIKN